MICNKCNNTVTSGTKFCAKCGADLRNAPLTENDGFPDVNHEQTISLADYGSPSRASTPPPPVTSTPTPSVISAPVTPVAQPTPIIAGEYDPRFDYTPLGMWTYFGYNLLFAIPLVGFILLLVFSFGGTRNINLRNYARSFFCWIIILAIIFVIALFFITVVLGTTLGALW